MKEEYREFDIGIIIEFIEKLTVFFRSLGKGESAYTVQYDHFKFIIHELFLYIIAVSLKNENYKFIEEILYSGYHFDEENYNYNRDPSSFSKLYKYVNSIDIYYKKNFSKNFYSPMADLMLKRIPDNFIKKYLIEADLLCYYIAKLNGEHWFPVTYLYSDEYKPLSFFNKMTSKRHFEKVKGIFDVENESELNKKLNTYKEKVKEKADMYPGAFRMIKPIYDIINLEKLATLR